MYLLFCSQTYVQTCHFPWLALKQYSSMYDIIDILIFSIISMYDIIDILIFALLVSSVLLCITDNQKSSELLSPKYIINGLIAIQTRNYQKP
jgi:hypothetical protein